MGVTIITQDDFNDNSIDTTKWDETDTTSELAEANQRIECVNDHTHDPQIEMFLKTDSSLSSGVVSVQGSLDWTDPGADESLGYIMLYVDANNYIRISNRTATGGYYRLHIFDGGSVIYNYYTTVAKGKTVKIEYDTVNQTVKFFYWNTDTWTQMGTTQTSVTLGSPIYAKIGSIDGNGFSNADIVYIDNVYLVQGSYSVNPPVNILDFVPKVIII